MIIANGAIEFKIKKTPKGLSPEGYPLKPIIEWSDAIPCQFYPNNEDLLARIGTENRQRVSYTILIERTVESEVLRLKDKDGKEVGEFSAHSIESLEAVGQIKIIV